MNFSHPERTNQNASLGRSDVIPSAGVKAFDGLRILLVDDCMENQFLFKRLLTRQGAEVTVADNGAEGLDYALENIFDLVLMDIEMPVMDGYEAVAKLKYAKYSPPVVALTAHSKQEEILKISAAGFAGYINKPVEIKILIDLVQSLVAAGEPHQRDPQ
jgi:CheY-like chemotaxis protein